MLNLPFSVLDLSPIVMGGSPADSLRNSLDLAQHAEKWGYRRYWLAEHHGMPGIASAATAVVIGHVAAGTTSIRVGAGGIMLPNHSPLVIAEQFGTLESLFPGRIDLGLGRAPGSDPHTARALRRNLASDPDEFPTDVIELMEYFATPGMDVPGLDGSGIAVPVDGAPTGNRRVRAIPGAGLRVPLWILGSSLFGAQVAAALGLPFAFASHFAPAAMIQAIDLYRSRFRPSRQLQKPYLMLGFNVFAADDDEQGQLLSTSMQQAFVNLRSGRPTPLPPPEAGYHDRLPAAAKAMLADVLACSAIGSAVTVERALHAFVERTQPDELMLTSQIFDHAARLHSFEIAAHLRHASPGWRRLERGRESVHAAAP